MPRDPRTFLWDAHRAAERIADFVDGRTFDDYKKDVLLRSGVERQLEIVGEALNQLSKLDPPLAERVPDLRQIVGLRNILLHGYAAVDDARIWGVVVEDLSPFRVVLANLLGELER